MTQKVLKVGSSAAVTIPKESLAELGLKIGDRIRVRVNRTNRTLSVYPEQKLSRRELRIAKLTQSVINRYRKDLEALAKK